MSHRPLPPGLPFSSESLTLPTPQTGPAAGPSFAPDPDQPDRRPEPALLTVPEVAAWMGTSEKTVRRRIRDGTIRTVPVGGRLVRIAPDEMRRLAGDDHRVGAMKI